MAYISANHITLYHQRENYGRAQALIFVNSLGSDYRIWDDMAPDLCDYNLLRYDLRGHGLSDCPSAPYRMSDHSNDLAQLILGLGLKNVVLVGISVGGMIAMDYAAQHPDKVKALVLLDTFPKIGTPEMW